MNWVVAVVKKYAVCNGRARRMEYWMFLLIAVLIAIGIGVIDALLRTRAARGVVPRGHRS